MLLIAPVAIILVAENLGHIKAVTRHDRPQPGPATWAAPSSATASPRWSSGAAGGTGVTTYAENIGVMAATKIYSTAMFVVAALIAMVLGFSPKFGALIQAIPLPVMGGVSIVVFGLIAVAGAKIWVDNRVDFSRQPQPDRRRHHAGARHRRLHAEVRRVRARRHRHRDLRRDPAVRAAEPLAPGVSARRGWRASGRCFMRAISSETARSDPRPCAPPGSSRARSRRSGSARCRNTGGPGRRPAGSVRPNRRNRRAEHRLRRGTQAVGVEVGLDRPDIEEGCMAGIAQRAFFETRQSAKASPDLVGIWRSFVTASNATWCKRCCAACSFAACSGRALRPLDSNAFRTNVFMADASAARTKAVFEFKSATLPLIAVILKTADLDVLAEALDVQLADSPDFFDQEPVVIDLSQLQDDAEAAAIDFAALRSLLARHQTQPIAVRGGNDAQNAAARAAGLSLAAMPVAPSPAPPAPPAEAPRRGAADRARSAGARQRHAGDRQAAALGPAGLCARRRPGRDWRWSTSAPRSSPTATSTSMRRCAARPSPARAATPRRASSRPAWKRSWCRSPASTAPPKSPLPADVAGKPAQVRLDGKKLVIEPIAS